MARIPNKHHYMTNKSFYDRTELVVANNRCFKRFSKGFDR